MKKIGISKSGVEKKCVKNMRFEIKVLTHTHKKRKINPWYYKLKFIINVPTVQY